MNRISQGTSAETTKGSPGRRVGYKLTKNLDPDIADVSYERDGNQSQARRLLDPTYVKYVPIVNAFMAVIMT